MLDRDEFIKICNKVYEKGFVAAYDGNISQRISEDQILITPSGRCKGELKADDLLVCDMSGNKIECEGKVSTENKIHLLAYKARPEVNAVVHCHPVYATALATTGGFCEPVFPEVILTLGKIPLCEYATPSTDQLPESLKPFIEFANALLLKNHGAMTVGRTLKEAYYRMEKLEHSAKTYSVAKGLGNLSIVSEAKLEELYSIAEKTYGIIIDERNKF